MSTFVSIFLRNNLICEIELSRELVLYFTISLFLLFLLKLLFCTYSLQCIYKYLCMLPNLVPCLATMCMKKGTKLVGQCHKCHSTGNFSATVPPWKFSESKLAPEYLSLTILCYTQFDTSDLESRLAPLSTMCKDRHGVLKFNVEKSHWKPGKWGWFVAFGPLTDAISPWEFRHCCSVWKLRTQH